MDFRQNYKIKQIELDTLLDLTNAINKISDENSLFKIFVFILLGNYRNQINKIALFIKEEEHWKCAISHGCETNYYESENIDEELLDKEEVLYIDENYPSFLSNDFDIMIPVIQSGKNTAMLGLKGLGKQDDYLQEHIHFIQTVSSILIVAVHNLRLNRQRLEQEALNQQMVIARQMQSYLFPKQLPDKPDLKIFSSYLPHYSVGGDYYDYIPISDDEFVICIADVSGKGIPASILMSNFQASLRILIKQELSLKEVVSQLNKIVFESAQGEKFITLFLAKYNIKDYTIHYINAGHNDPVMFFDNMEYKLLSEGTTILGGFYELPLLESGYISNCKNTLLFSYTDGLIENFNEKEEEFELEKVIPVIKENKDLSQLHSELLDALKNFKGNDQMADDITMLSCSVS